MVDDEAVLFLRNFGDFQDFDLFGVVLGVGKDLFEDLLEVVLVLDGFNGFQSLKVDLDLLNVGLFLLPKHVGLVGLADHSSDQKSLISGKNALDFSRFAVVYSRHSGEFVVVEFKSIFLVDELVPLLVDFVAVDIALSEHNLI